jgi:hypothetical protein
MLQATCPQLRGIAKLLREKYDLRFALMIRDASEDELRHAEAEVILANRKIANHRRRCPHCTSVFTTVPPVRSRSLVLDTSS